ncbi:hypothetical protein HanPI659440_Chr11g0419971 [Helianthus annuus]|nr:hypothetical protein HanPI659440_Chr11g0419971 [Helianthus annuus]
MNTYTLSLLSRKKCSYKSNKDQSYFPGNSRSESLPIECPLDVMLWKPLGSPPSLPNNLQPSSQLRRLKSTTTTTTTTTTMAMPTPTLLNCSTRVTLSSLLGPKVSLVCYSGLRV